MGPSNFSSQASSCPVQQFVHLSSRESSAWQGILGDIFVRPHRIKDTFLGRQGCPKSHLYIAKERLALPTPGGLVAGSCLYSVSHG